MKVLLWVGSPKPPGTSTSEALLVQLGENLVHRGVSVQERFQARRTHKGGFEAFFRAAEASDAVVLAAPIYFDALPYVVTASLERWAERRGARRGGPRFGMLVNCGFPELRHCELALEMGQLFCGQTGLSWMGGAGLPGGAVVNGETLAETGGRTHHVRAGLDLVADAISKQTPWPKAAQHELARPVMPPWLYRTAASAWWLWQAYSHGALMKLGDRPYETPSSEDKLAGLAATREP